MQDATGYRYTIKKGVPTLEDGQLTGDTLLGFCAVPALPRNARLITGFAITLFNPEWHTVSCPRVRTMTVGTRKWLTA